MAINDDQPRPDLDAAVDAVLPSLTAVSDDAAAASLRRTRVALADAAPGREGAGVWRWGLTVVAAALIVLASSLASWRSRAPEPGSTVERRPANPAVVATPPAPSAPPVTPVPVAPERVATAPPAPRSPGRRRSVPVQATSAVPTTPESSRPDPLVALVRAVQAIPEDAWDAASAGTDVTLSPIAIAPLETPPIPEAPSRQPQENHDAALPCRLRRPRRRAVLPEVARAQEPDPADAASQTSQPAEVLGTQNVRRRRDHP